MASNKGSSVIICSCSHNSLRSLCVSALMILFFSVQKFNVWVLICASNLEFPKDGYEEGFHIGKGTYGLEVPLVPKEGLPKYDSEGGGG